MPSYPLRRVTEIGHEAFGVWRLADGTIQRVPMTPAQYTQIGQTPGGAMGEGWDGIRADLGLPAGAQWVGGVLVRVWDTPDGRRHPGDCRVNQDGTALVVTLDRDARPDRRQRPPEIPIGADLRTYARATGADLPEGTRFESGALVIERPAFPEPERIR
jgi:hypothetical protein